MDEGVHHEAGDHEPHGVDGGPDVGQEEHAGVVVHVQGAHLPELVPQEHECGVAQLEDLRVYVYMVG